MTEDSERTARQQEMDRSMALLASWAHPDQAEREALRPILDNELVITQKAISRSPELFKAGKSSRIPVVVKPFPKLSGETSTEYHARVDAEAARQGVHYTELYVRVVKTKYWELQSEHTGFWDKPIVYVRGRRLGTFSMKARHLFYKDDPYWEHWDTSWIHERQPYDLDAKEMKDAIQGLRLLRTPFNGAIVIEE